MSDASPDTPPIPPPSQDLGEFLDGILTALQLKDVTHIDATPYSPKFNEIATVRIQLLSTQRRYNA